MPKYHLITLLIVCFSLLACKNDSSYLNTSSDSPKRQFSSSQFTINNANYISILERVFTAYNSLLLNDVHEIKEAFTNNTRDNVKPDIASGIGVYDPPGGECKYFGFYDFNSKIDTSSSTRVKAYTHNVDIYMCLNEPEHQQNGNVSFNEYQSTEFDEINQQNLDKINLQTNFKSFEIIKENLRFNFQGNLSFERSSSTTGQPQTLRAKDLTIVHSKSYKSNHNPFHEKLTIENSNMITDAYVDWINTFQHVYRLEVHEFNIELNSAINNKSFIKFNGRFGDILNELRVETIIPIQLNKSLNKTITSGKLKISSLSGSYLLLTLSNDGLATIEIENTGDNTIDWSTTINQRDIPNKLHTQVHHNLEGFTILNSTTL